MINTKTRRQISLYGAWDSARMCTEYGIGEAGLKGTKVEQRKYEDETLESIQNNSKHQKYIPLI